MMKRFGAFNSKGFSAQLSEGRLPQDSHITYQGVFNELEFNVGAKTQKLVDLHYGFSRYQYKESCFDPETYEYLSLFLKSQRDGAQRHKDIIFNCVVCLDISGSMDTFLQRSKPKSSQQQQQEVKKLSSQMQQNPEQKPRSRLSLSIQAIKMLISRLRPQDSFGLVTFNSQGHVIIQPTLKKNLKESVYEDLDKIKAYGGTSIISGYMKSKQVLQKYLKQSNNQNQQTTTNTSVTQNRIIMLTDVCDNSVSTTQKFLNECSTESTNIHSTIIGVSSDFKSQTCEALKKVKGFNYFCATNQDDIKKHVFELFDFHYFSAAMNVEIGLMSEDVVSFETYGATDGEEVAGYNGWILGEAQRETPTIKKLDQEKVVTKIKTVFPSELKFEKGQVLTIGGVILLKLKRGQNSPKNVFNGKLSLSYDSIFSNEKIKQTYDLHFQFPQNEQYFSEECLRQALEGYTFTHEIKTFLKQKDELEKNLDFMVKFYQNFKNLEAITPKSKETQLKRIKEIIEKKITQLKSQNNEQVNR